MGPLFPNVPIAIGVPPVLRIPGDTPPAAPTLRSDSAQLENALYQWGVFDEGGAPIVEPDNIASIDDAVEYRIANYPLEAGAFESYNKVATPIEIHLAMSKGGKLTERQDFLKKLKGLESKLDRYHVITPEEVFINMNIAAVRKGRNQAQGATMLTVEVTFQEVRITATAKISNSKAPAGADPVSTGQVQTTTVDEAGFPAFPPFV